MKTQVWIPILFGLAAAYDGVLGLLFLVVPGYPYEVFGVTPPNHMGYVQFPAALLLIFGLMFTKIALNPIRHRDLILYGIFLKTAYCGVSGWHWISAGIPDMWKPFTLIDLVMWALFIWAYTILRSAAGESKKA